MDHLISRLFDIGLRCHSGSRWMRVKDAQQIEPAGVDPCKGLKLLIRIHHEAHRTLCLVPYQDHPLHPVIFACEQPTGFQRRMLVDVFQHLLPVVFAQYESLLHYIIVGTLPAPSILPG